MKKTFATYSFGCRVNQAEMQRLAIKLINCGFVYDDKTPDFFIVNTCAVTSKAETEVRQFLNRIKRKHPDAKIIMTGCSITKWLLEKKIFPDVVMINNQKKDDIFDLITSIVNQNLKKSFDFCVSKWRFEKYLSSKRMILKIQDGCQRFCSYCIVPYLRGKPQSERIKNLVLKIKKIEKDIKEVILTAINTEAYGLDTGETFNDLIENILTKTKLGRLSFGSIHPWSINSEFIKLYKKYAENDRFVDFFHIPLQSGSDKILSLMKRQYTRQDLMDKLDTINNINPFSFIGTDVIVGFLDETDKDFEETYNFLEKSPVSKFHIFRFSIREKTAAYFLAKRLKEPSVQMKIKRAKILFELGRKKYQAFLAKHVGKAFPALFLSKGKDNLQWALLSNQIPVIVNTDKNLVGEIKIVKVIRLLKSHLQGVPL